MRKSSPAWSLSGKLKRTAKKLIIPGPGAYNPKPLFADSSPQYSIPQTSRMLCQRYITPGPGSYNTKFVGNVSPRAIINKSKRLNRSIVQETPGPGAYNLNSEKGPSFTMINSRKEPKNADRPGPGQYSVINVPHSKSPAFSIGKAKRKNSYSTPSPGPGAYDVHDSRKSPAFKIGTEEKLPVAHQNIPGPGAYDIDLTPKKSGFSITSRHYLTPKNFGPGPGAYENGAKKEGPGWKFSKSSKFIRKHNNQPGPGAYEIVSTISNLPSYAKIN